ncbi:MAG: 5-(carboxyamino)imidazole ribonucleotide synthase [Bacteroidota bacterium]|nr:5-(carboxyamino)imidazole ribonucleotide synthase [Bacteroidota bacterium]
MKQKISSDFKLGILGGGQLGKMMIQAASKWDIEIHVLDPDESCSCSALCHQFHHGSFKNYNDVLEFGRKVDILTFEIEHINIEALKVLEKDGIKTYPQPEALEIIQDKGIQKQFYSRHNIPTSNFHLFNNKKEILNAIHDDIIHFPFIQKSRKDGYDGKGVVFINDVHNLDRLFDVPSMIEEFIEIEKEIAVIVSRNENGETNTFPTVEMEFSSEANLVEQLICPSEIRTDLDHKAKELAISIIENLNMVGNLAVEFFISKNGLLLVNEVAPRPHNSGHQTIEANITSQFEQHLRAILNYPLGSTKLLSPSVMLNILGEPNHTGKVFYKNFETCLSKEGIYIHIYGKKITKPFRKMGHVTIVDETMEKAKEKAKFVKETLKVISND